VASQPVVELAPDRREAVDARQTWAASLLREMGCEALIVAEPENFAWLTSGATVRGLLDPASAPCLLFTAEQRWVMCSNVDSQRLFDEEVDGLGFLLKEWPWHWGREQLVADLCHGRKVVCDQRRPDAEYVGDRLRRKRRALDGYDQACLSALGQILVHAIEATCRTAAAGETEREIAAQVSHRLLHRGAQPVVLSVAADGRSRLYRRPGFTSARIEKYCVVSVTARKYGTCAGATRTISFGPPDDVLRREHDAATKVSAAYVASTWPDAVPREILLSGRRVYQVCDYEHEWQLAPQGYVTGRAPVELALTPKTEDLFEPGWAVTWRAGAGAAVSCDTFLVTEEGPRPITPVEAWPLRRIRIQGADFLQPDILQR
ncbi:MAG TPA: M24 family metallopeptidase, partial [Gemmataceae bacterium]|nr:M24 family metallopeptidase [Gemmataceae bacterium]